MEYIGQILKKKLRDALIEKETTFKVRGGKRRTDILAKFKDQASVCYELQCSPISSGEFSDRTLAYTSRGYRVVWILGPDASGIKYPPAIDSLKDFSKGVKICIKFTALSILQATGYLALYFPEKQERLLIAYCVDGVFDRKRDLTLTRGEKQIVVTMPEVELAVVPMEFEQDGIPYAHNFPHDQLDPLHQSTKRSQLSVSYARELIRYKHRTIPKLGTSKHLPKQSSGQKKESGLTDAMGPRCSLCRRTITDMHYHKCTACGCILDAECTKKIEAALLEEEHNMTGWVRHCEWVSASHTDARKMEKA